MFIVDSAIKFQQLNLHLHQLPVVLVVLVAHLLSPSVSAVLAGMKHILQDCEVEYTAYLSLVSLYQMSCHVWR